MPTPRQKIDFNIKLLSGNNVILVDCPGYESELFMPQIVKGRITIQNIIPKHRCCDAADVATSQIPHKSGLLNQVNTLPVHRKHLAVQSRLSSTSTPLAKSTPSSKSSTNRFIEDKENETLLRTLSPARCNPNTSELPLITDYLMSPCAGGDSVVLTSIPIQYSPEHNISNPKNDSPSQSELDRKTPPARTYSKRKVYGKIPSNLSPSSSKQIKSCTWPPIQKKKIPSTKPPIPIMKLEVRNRKLIVDSKKSLGPFEPERVIESNITKKKIIKKQVTGKTRKQFEALKTTAFDLLTMPVQSKLTKTLMKQFRKSCIDKRATTLPNYAEVATVAPLQMDRQVKSLFLKQQRLEKLKTTKTTIPKRTPPPTTTTTNTNSKLA